MEGKPVNNPFYKLLLEIVNNPAIDTEIPRKLLRNKGLKLSYIEPRFAIALILYHVGGIIQVPSTSPRACADAIGRTFYSTIVKNPLLKEFVEYWWGRRRGRTKKEFTEYAFIEYLLRGDFLKEGDYIFYEVKVENGTLIMRITPLFAELAKTVLPEIAVSTAYAAPSSTQTKEEEKEERKEEKQADFWDVLLSSIKVIMPSDKEELLSVPVLKFFYNRAEGNLSRGDIFFLVLDINELINWARDTKIYKLYPYYDTFSDEEAAKEFILTRLIELLQADEEAYFRTLSIAINKILEKIYEKLKDINAFRGHVPFEEFVKVSLLMSRTSEARNIVLTVLRNPNFMFVFPKELLNKSKYATVMLRASGVYAQEESNIALESHMIFKCKDCGRYFVGEIKEKIVHDEETGKKKREKEFPSCIFCQGANVEALYSTSYKFKPTFVSYNRTDTQQGSEKFYVYSSVAEILGPIVEAESTPLVFVPFHQYEKKGTSPIRKMVPILVGIIDVELLEEEGKLDELTESAIEKLERVKDPIQKLIILARSVNRAQSSKILKYVDYAIASHLISLATATNRKIIIQYSNGHNEIIQDIKPSINLLSIGESGAAKSTIKDKLSLIFPDKVLAFSLYKFTARQLSGYVSQYKPKKSILASMPNKMLILDEATYAREEEVYAVFRNILEYGKLEDGSIINTAFTFIMNDPLNVNLDAAKGLRSIRNALKAASEIQKKFGDFNTILEGLYSYMMLGLVSMTFTKAFLERIRMFIVARDYSKIYANIIEVTKKYASELSTLEAEDLLLSPKELRALFVKRVFPITTIVVPEDVANLATKYAKFYSIILRKVGEKLDENIEGIEVKFANLMDVSVERIKNALILISSGIAKLLRFEDAYEEENEIYIVLRKEDVELAKYFFIIFSPDYLQELSMKQIDEIFKHLESNIDKIDSGELSAIEFDTLLTVASQIKVQTIDVQLQEDIKSVKITPDLLADIVIQIIRQSYETQTSYIELMEPIVKSMVGEVPQKTLEEICDKIMIVIDTLRKQEKIHIDQNQVVYDIFDKSILSKKRMRLIVSTIDFIHR